MAKISGTYSSKDVQLHFLGDSTSTTAVSSATEVEVTDLGNIPSEMDFDAHHIYGSIEGRQNPTNRQHQNVDFSVKQDPSDALQTAIGTAHDAQTLTKWAITLGGIEGSGDGETLTFTAYVGKWERGTPIDGLATLDGMLNITGGKPVLTENS